MSKIIYFDEEGQVNLEHTMKIVAEVMQKHGDLKGVIFSSQGDGPRLITSIDKTLKERLIILSFPFGLDSDINEERNKNLELLKKEDFKVLISNPTFRDIYIPNSEDPKRRAIVETLRLFCGGMILCVEAILMASDANLVEENQIVVAACSDTAIIATSVKSEFMFFPQYGIEIQEILCKPRRLTLSRKLKYNPEEE